MVAAASLLVTTGGLLALLLTGPSETDAASLPSFSALTANLPASDLAGDGPATGNQAALEGTVSCAGADLCFAVGAYLDAAGDTAADIETITSGGSGSPTLSHLAAPVPSEAPSGNPPASSGTARLLSELYAVSCASASSCVAVGVYQDSAGEDFGLIDSWNGTTWTAGTAPEPAGDADERGPGSGSRQVATLWDVDCYAPGWCVAVGTYGDTVGHDFPLIDTLYDGTWYATTTSVPGGPANAGYYLSAWLYSVSCDAAGSCAAVGGFNTEYESIAEGILATGSGNRWTAAAAPLPSGITYDEQVVSVSCPPQGGTCMALGGARPSGIVAYADTGGTWSASSVPLPAATASVTPYQWDNEGNEYYEVSCPSDGDCIGAANLSVSTGGQGGALLTQSGSGFDAQMAPLATGTDGAGYPASAGDASLQALSCGQAGACVAVGYTDDTHGDDWGLVESLTGTSWSGSFAPDPAGSGTDADGDQQAALFAVGCSAAGACAVSGTDQTPAATSALDTAFRAAS